VAALTVVLVMGMAGCGGSASTTSTTGHATHTHSASRSAVARRAPIRVTYRPLFSLPAPVQDPAFATLPPDRFVLLGGIDASGGSTGSVVLADLEAPLGSAALPGPQHDAQAATLNGKVYVFGGGYLSELDHILRYDSGSGTVTAVGTLPTPSSDVAVTATAGSAYIVGGFDGTNWLDSILAWRPGAPPRVVARLPIGLRYAAATTVDGDVMIIGGSSPSGATAAIYRFDPRTRAVAQIGRLARPITHATAAALNGTVYLVGGRSDNLDGQTASVWAIDPTTGRVRRAGRLPQPLSDAAAVAVGDAIIVAGGRTPAGPQPAVGELVPTG
jgi:N-acetylneuraminic acid mutarotase